MRASTQQQRCVAIVDPISTGACVAVEATKRGYAVVAVWSAVVTKDLRNMVPEHAKGLRYRAQVDEGESIEATAQLLRKAAAPHKVDAVICGAEVRHATAAARPSTHQADICAWHHLSPHPARASRRRASSSPTGCRSGAGWQATAPSWATGGTNTRSSRPPAIPAWPTLLPLHRRPRPILPVLLRRYAKPACAPCARRSAPSGRRSLAGSPRSSRQTARCCCQQLDASPVGREHARHRLVPLTPAVSPRPRSSSSQSRARARTASSCAPRWRSQRHGLDMLRRLC